MKLRRFLYSSVVFSIVAAATILYLPGTLDTPQAPNSSVPQPIVASSPIINQDKDIEATPAATDPIANEADSVEVKSIDAYCKMVDADCCSQDESPDIIFADVADYTAKKKGKWQSFASEKALERFRKKTETYSIFFNWKKGDRIVKSNLTLLYNPTGDFVKDVYQYFREDGSLAFVLSHFGTFIGEYKFEQREHFDRNGRLISKTEKYYSFYSDKPIETKPEEEDDMSDLRDRIDYYMAVNKLPFAHLLPAEAE